MLVVNFTLMNVQRSTNYKVLRLVKIIRLRSVSRQGVYMTLQDHKDVAMKSEDKNKLNITIYIS